jgi:hypothetical protein
MHLNLTVNITKKKNKEYSLMVKRIIYKDRVEC